MEILKTANINHPNSVNIGVLFFVLLTLIGGVHKLYALPNDLSPGGKWVLSDEVFYSGKSKLNYNNIAELKTLGKYLQARPNLKILVQGHWDNSFDEETARRISDSRAKAIKNYLVRNYTINPEYIKTTGYGSLRPLSDPNATASQNRRVEVVALTAYTEKPVTDKGLAINCSAYLSLIDGAVQTKGPWDSEFNDGRYQQQIYEGHQISVFYRSRSALRLKDGSIINIYDNSRIVFNGPQYAESYANLNIRRGKVELDLRPSVVRDQFVVKIPSGKIVLNGTKAVINVETINDSVFTLFSLIKGKADAVINDEYLVFSEGQGFKMLGKNAKPEIMDIPPQPRPMLPLNNQTVSAGLVKFNWLPSTDYTLFEVSKKNNFSTIFIQKQTKENELEENLPSGTFYWRIRHFDENGLESDISEPRQIFATAEYISHSLVEKNISEAAKKGAKAKLELNISDTTVSEKIFTIKGNTEPGSKIYIDDYQLKTQNLYGSFEQKIQLDKGKNEMQVRVRAQNGLENSKTVVVEYDPPSRYKFSIMVIPVIPLTLEHHDYGFTVNAVVDYTLNSQMCIRGMFGVGGLMANPEAYAKTSGSNELTSIIDADLGLLFILAPDSPITPYLEGSLGFMFWNRNSTVIAGNNSLNRISFTPGMGFGVKAKLNDHYIGLGAFYRIYQHLDEKLDLGTNNNNDSVMEMRFTYWF